MAGVANHDAIRVAARIGFTPLEVIRMATLSGATFLGIQDRVGRIAVGKEADLLVVRGDPSRRIEDIDAVEIVFVNGIAYDPARCSPKSRDRWDGSDPRLTRKTPA